LAPEVVTACREAGLFALAAPGEVGGLEATLVDIFEVMEMLAAADPSTAWYVLNSAPCARAGAWIDPTFWPDVYRAPMGNFGFSAAPKGRLRPAETDDGYILSGTWPLMTGVLDAPWAAVFCLLERPDDRPALRQAVIPTADLAVKEIWQDAVAMRGTGSHEVTATNCRVPAGLVMDPLAPARIDRPLYRCGPFILPGALNSAVPIGILRSAMQSVSADLRDKVGSIFGQRAAQSTALLELVADASVAVDHLHYGVKAALGELWSYAERSKPAPISLRATIIGSPYRAAEVARDFISRLYTRSSRAAFFAGHPLERAMRDIHAVVYGIDTLRALHHDTGRVAIGLDPLAPGF
jgi:alkylation response protein AidB-like acyl-CoA dehydrogenase